MTDLVTIDHAARLHSPVGGSSAERVLRCPGSVQLSARYPGTESDFAAEGTACHEAMDLILGGETTKTDSDVIGLTFNGIVMTEELYRETVRPALDYLDKLQYELGSLDFFNECRVVFPGIEGAFGTADIVGVAHDRTVLIDWKFGRGVAVEATENEQLMYYAWAAMHTPPTDKFFARDRPIELFIVQPRVNDGEPFTRWMTTTLQLEAFAASLRRAVVRAFEPDPPFALGSWCKFCPAKIGCPLYLNLATNSAALSLDERSAQVNQLIGSADLFIELGKAIKEEAHALLERGVKVPGWKLVNKRANRDWVDDAKALRYFAKIGIPAAERHVKKIISPKGAEDTLKKHSLPAVLPKALVKAESLGTTLAPESDTRPAVVAAPQALKLLAASLAARS